jgi:DNA polymerase-3 subunit gamma/tau
MSLALARKYRPRNFASVAVQTHVSKTLRGAIARNRIAHAYLLCGPRGTGKTTLARVLAMALNCERRESQDLDGEPCGQCASCQRIWGGSASLDVVEIDAASNRGVDDARDLRERAMYAPSEAGHHKVYIIDEAHMLTREAWNALLKILEEPPPRVVFVFATTEPQRIAQTAAPVMSRMQRFDLKRIGPADIRARLADVMDQEGISADNDAIAMIARAAEGSMRDALSLTDQVLAQAEGRITVEGVRESLGLVAEEEYLQLFDIIARRDAKAVFPAVERLGDAGVDFTTFLNGLADLLRARLAIELGGAAGDIGERVRSALADRKGELSSGDLLRMLNIIGELEPRFRKSSQQALLLEMLLVRFCLLDATVQIADLIGAVGGSAPSNDPPRGSQGRDTPVAAPRSGTRELADSQKAAAPSPAKVPLDINRLAEKWDEIVEDLRRAGRVMLAGHFAAALPTAVSGRGVITVQLDESHEAAFDLVQDALVGAQSEVLDVVRSRFTEAEKVVLAPRRNAPGSTPVATRRLTQEALRAEKLDILRKKDPVLDAAVRELDLELID